MTRLQRKLPVIPKRGAIEIRGTVQSRFATYEDIFRLIGPLLQEEGFSVSFDSAHVEKGVEFSCKVSHVGGHSEIKEFTLPADTSGSKNAIQALGSSASYARRYLVIMHFNLIVKDEDDDAHTAVGLIDESEIKQILDLFQQCRMDDSSKRKFFDLAKVDAIEDISKAAFPGLIAQLNQKLRSLQKQAPR